MNGFLNLLKPPGMTSSNAVVFVRRLLKRGTKVGHAGTLDPEAAGVLPIMVGNATRLFDYVVNKEKTYIAEIDFGAETDTQDAQGTITRQSTLSVDSIADSIDENAIKSILPRLVGEIDQIPPMYSALSRDGKKLYEMARSGEVLEIEPRRVTVHSIEYLSRTSKTRHMLEIHCGKGTYIRTICQDMGRLLGTCAHMSFLLRTKSGPFDIEEALTQEEVRGLSDKGELQSRLMPMDEAVSYMPKIICEDERHKKHLYSGMFRPEWFDLSMGEIKGGQFLVYYRERFVGIYSAGLSVLNPEEANADN